MGAGPFGSFLAENDPNGLLKPLRGSTVLSLSLSIRLGLIANSRSEAQQFAKYKSLCGCGRFLQKEPTLLLTRSAGHATV